MSWNGLSALICCHWNLEHGDQRIIYLTHLLGSLKTNKVLPDNVLISFTSENRKRPTIELGEYPFAIKTIYRGKKAISQSLHLLMTIYEERPRYLLLLDDDDLTSPYLVQEHYQRWLAEDSPENFYFHCALTRGSGEVNPIVFDTNWKIHKKNHLLEDDYDYGGTCCSTSVMKYYLKYLLVRQWDLTNFAIDVQLASMGHYTNKEIMFSYISNSPSTCIFDKRTDKEIRKAFIAKPLYYHRKWRRSICDGVRNGNDEEILDLIAKIKERQKY